MAGRQGGGSPAAAALLAAAVLAAAAGAGHCWELSEGTQGVVRLEDGTTLQLQEFRGTSKWAALQYVFSTAEVLVDCPGLKVGRLLVGRGGRLPWP